ncbi:MAG: hypothetical protein M3362_01335 [Acidobacteriota bacterium]|nr:hypothetical protein [Acidobacteriota bacterium]
MAYNEGVYRATVPSLSDGQTVGEQVDQYGNKKVTQATALAGEDLPNDLIRVEERFDYNTPITASTLIKTGVGRFAGFFVSAASVTPTITVYDNTSAAGTKIIDTFTPVAGTLYRFPTTNFTVGLYIAISGTVTLTPFYK